MKPFVLGGHLLLHKAFLLQYGLLSAVAKASLVLVPWTSPVGPYAQSPRSQFRLLFLTPSSVPLGRTHSGPAPAQTSALLGPPDL